MQLTVRELTKSFGETRALGGVSFTASSGSPFGLLGRNGAGKTTAMRIIMGIFDADGGEVLLDGKPLGKSGAKVGYLPEERGLYRKTTIREQLIYFARLRGMSAPAAKKALDEWLERIDLTEYRDKKVETLSKGNQQRIQLALTLINDPDVVILDEPFSGLDPVNALQLRQIVREVAEKGRLVLFSSHQMNVVEDFCDEVVILSKGRIVLDGRLSELRSGYPKDRIRIMPDTAAIRALVEKYGAVNEERGALVVRLQDEAVRGQLLHALADSGEDIAMFETVAPSLEEIFVSVAGDEEKGGEAK